MKILALIPARGGSKGIPNKNIKDFKGKPLIAWSIKNAHESKHINRTILSSDSNEMILVIVKHLLFVLVKSLKIYLLIMNL